MSFPRFAELETSVIAQSVWKAGGPNSVVGSKTARVKVTSLCLTEGDPYEIEGAIGPVDGAAEALAVAQDVARVATQLKVSPPISSDLLSEYQPARVTRLAVEYVPVLLVVGEAAETRFGLKRNFNEPTLLAGMHPWRRVVRALRAEGWKGAIQLQGPTQDAFHLVIPRRFAQDGSLKIEWTGKRGSTVPRALVEYAIGERREFPRDSETFTTSRAGRQDAAGTRSWRPPSPLRLIEDAN